MVEQRFLTLPEVSEILHTSMSQTRALVRSGELPAIQIGGRSVWRVEIAKLEEYIAQAYEKTAENLASAVEEKQ
ncbi:helix-turn-helix domain-containing protein [Rothia sp. LK2588]|uniref:helix-turn-helix domain-containing protein n=1 Tax=Rothia sp. LK2588 TaxID=3114369 RepID=UPI0034CF3C4E